MCFERSAQTQEFQFSRQPIVYTQCSNVQHPLINLSSPFLYPLPQFILGKWTNSTETYKRNNYTTILHIIYLFIFNFIYLFICIRPRVSVTHQPVKC